MQMPLNTKCERQMQDMKTAAERKRSSEHLKRAWLRAITAAVVLEPAAYYEFA